MTALDARCLWHCGSVISVATTEGELRNLCARLRELGVRSMEVVAPGNNNRRVVLAQLDDEWASEPLAASLRAEGAMAVARPEPGPRLDSWFRDTRPIVFEDRLSVCPVWSEHERGGLPGLIELGPGGFGSGRHPTTRLIVDELTTRISGGERVLDVGCGSGILALCALKLGAAGAVATDLSGDAVDATRRNAELNGLGDRLEATLAPRDHIEETFDVVVANIARAGIVGLASELVAWVSPNGWLAVSGISPSQCSQVADFLRPLVEVERRTSGEWSSLVLARP